MARPKTIRSFIDELPEVQRRQVVDAILAGKSTRKVAKLAGCSHTVIQDYKRKAVLPALRTAQQVQSFQPLPPTNVEAITQTARLTKDIIQASPFRERLEKLWDRTEKALNTAETSKDLGVMAPLLNQAHKNVHMLGVATGEIEQVAAANVAIQIVMPQAPAAPPTACKSDPGEVIDITPVKP